MGKIPVADVDYSQMTSQAVAHEIFDSILREIRDEVKAISFVIRHAAKLTQNDLIFLNTFSQLASKLFHMTSVYRGTRSAMQVFIVDSSQLFCLCVWKFFKRKNMCKNYFN